MKFTARQIADLLSGQVEGDQHAEVHTIAKIEAAGEGSLAFLANPKYTPFLYTTNATIVLVSRQFIPEKPVRATLIRVENPYDSFAQLLELVQQVRSNKRGVSPNASVHPSAILGNDVYVGDFAFIGERARIGDGVKIYPQVYVGDDVQIGDSSTLFPGVKAYQDTQIGNNCIIHAGVVLGADGFGFAIQQDHHYRKVPQIGNVVIEDFVEIGANTTIDRATMGSTIIRKGVKLDNLIQIGHNVEVGEDTVIAALTGVSGSTRIGSRCMIAGQVGFVGHVEIADEVKIGAQAGIAGHVKEKGALLLGSPAIDAGLFKRAVVIFKRLPDIFQRLQTLEKQIGDQHNSNATKA
jgi:UDP-3-O-[3-hydroxymyristoyl] glucosamine N-acyltransferase